MKNEQNKKQQLSKAEMKQLTGGDTLLVGFGKNCSTYSCYLPYVCSPWKVCASINGETYPAQVQ